MKTTLIALFFATLFISACTTVNPPEYPNNVSIDKLYCCGDTDSNAIGSGETDSGTETK